MAKVRPSPEQINPRPFQFPCAGTRKNKLAIFIFFNQKVNKTEEGRYFLNFINDDGCFGWIPSNEAVPLNGGAAGRLGGSHITRPPTVHLGRSMMVAKETPLLLGHDADDARAIGVLEVQAKLDVIGNGKRASIRFSPRVLAAPEGLTFFADDADLAVVPP